MERTVGVDRPSKFPYYRKRKRKPPEEPFPKAPTNMTVCIAALCNNDTLVAVSDRKVTISDLGEYDSVAAKMVILPTHNISILIADNLSAQSAVFAELRKIIMPTDTDINHLPVNEVAKLYKTIANRIQTETENEPIFRKYGLTAETFISRQHEMSDWFISRVADELSEVDPPPVAAVIAGYDENDRPQIYRMAKGSLTIETEGGFAAVGSGQWHATAAMMDFQFTRGCPVPEGIFKTYAAKKRAQIATGVGDTTFVAYFDKSGFHRLMIEVEAHLESYFKTMETKQTHVRNEFEQKFSKMFYEYAEKYDSSEGKITFYKVESE
jgi:hypothetical protein